MDKVVPAIYKITNLVNGKLYIGSTKDYRLRRTRHFYELRANRHGNARLQNAFNKYGEDNFKMEMLMPVTPHERDFYEQMFIDMLSAADRNIGYNILPTVVHGGMVPGIFKHSAETKQKIRLANLGQRRSAEARKNMSDAQKRLFASGYVHPNKGRSMSGEARATHREAMKQRCKAVTQLTAGGESIASFLSLAAAQDGTGVRADTVSLCCRGAAKSAGGFAWRWAK